jgi:hypothetical protein
MTAIRARLAAAIVGMWVVLGVWFIPAPHA